MTAQESAVDVPESRNSRTIVALAAHEPLLDPRISWAANSIAARYGSIVVGLADHNGVCEEREVRQGFAIVRLARKNFVPPGFGRVAARSLVALTLKQNPGLKKWLLVLAPLGFLAVPLLWFAELMRTLLRATLRLTPFTVMLVRTSLRYARRLLAGRTTTRPTIYTRWADFRWLLRHIFGSNASFASFVDEEPGRYCAIYCHDLDTLYAGIYLKRRHGIPVIYDAHENWPHANPGAPRYHVTFFTWFERTLAREADLVMTVSEPLADQLRRRHGLSDVIVMPNAEPFEELPIALSTDMSALAGDRVRFLFQGAFAPERGLDEVLEYWTSVDGAKAALFLRGRKTAERDRLEERAHALGLLGKSVYMLPPVSEDELIAASREADVGIIPYRNDLPAYVVACPNKLSQYMQAGCAILTADLPFVSKVVREAQAGASYDFRSRQSFVNAVAALSNREAIEAMKVSAREYTSTTYHWDAYAPLMMERIDRIVAAKAASQPSAA